MPKIFFAKGRPSIEVAQGSNLMESLMRENIPVASSCGGEGVCTKCVLKILEGKDNLSPPNDVEKDLHEIHDFARNERVSCQTQVLGDIKVDATYW